MTRRRAGIALVAAGTGLLIAAGALAAAGGDWLAYIACIILLGLILLVFLGLATRIRR